MSPISWGVGLPVSGLAAAALAMHAARSAEALGFDAVWAIDELAGPGVDGPACLAAAAAATDRIGLGLGVAPGRRAPAWSAKHLTAIDALAPGRLRLGLDLVGGSRASLSDGPTLLGLARGKPTERTAPGVPPARLAPALAADPPLLVGGSDRAALRRAAEQADTWIGPDLSPGAFAEASATLAEIARELGRATPQTGVLLSAVIDGDPDGSRDRIDDAVARLTAYIELGAETFLLTSLDPMPQAIERVAEIRSRLAAASAP